MSILDQRAAAVAQTMARIRRIEHDEGVTPAMLDAIKQEVTALASQTALFPLRHFPVPSSAAGVYRLAEDADLRFALYASVGLPGKAQPPHNHTTWAVISGVHGDEHNVFYERTDNRGTPGEGTLRKTGELTVRRGNAVGFLPDDFHTIEVTGTEPSVHLHCYGRSLEHLPERIVFATKEGGAYRHFSGPPAVRTAVVEAAELKAMLGDGEELALLDVREEGVFSKRHMLFACALPLSQIELRVDALLPRKSVRIVLCDADDGLAERAALKLMHLGYANLAVLRGGIEAWAAAGYELFSGVNVPSKAFGEFVEHHYNTPRMEAAEVKALMDAGTDMVVLDSRPMKEYRLMSIPTALDCPGAELVHRIHDLAPDPGTLVVVNCAGRTRSILGAQSLINAGIPNRVVALKNGTMGWHLAGLAVERGQSRMAPPPSPDGRAKGQAAAARVGQRFGVRSLDAAGLAALEAERESRSLYLLDVRSPEEFAAGHRPGSRSAPGGQLVQATDHYAPTRNARLVLIDDDGVRATMTASWLMQMGWTEVFVLKDGLAGPLETGSRDRTIPGLDGVRAEAIAPAALKALLDAGQATVIDLDTSLAYRAGHIPGAWFAVRSRLAASLAAVGAAPLYVLTSADGILARLAAPELEALAQAPVKTLAGGTAAWREAGLPLAAGLERLAAETDDVWYRPYDNQSGVEAAMRDYLSWEVDLVAQVNRDGDARFRLPG